MTSKELNKDIHGDLPGPDPAQIKMESGRKFFDPPNVFDPELVSFRRARAHVVFTLEGDHAVMEYVNVNDGIMRLKTVMHGARPSGRYGSDAHIGMLTSEQAAALARKING